MACPPPPQHQTRELLAEAGPGSWAAHPAATRVQCPEFNASRLPPDLWRRGLFVAVNLRDNDGVMANFIRCGLVDWFLRMEARGKAKHRALELIRPSSSNHHHHHRHPDDDDDRQIAHLARLFNAPTGAGTGAGSKARRLFVSVYESNSQDATPQWLEELRAELQALGVPHAVVSGGERRVDGREDRIAFLARMRNRFVGCFMCLLLCNVCALTD